MLGRLFLAVTWLVVSALPAAGSLQGVIDSATGTAGVRGITSEIFVAFDLPSEFVRPESRQISQSTIHIFPVPTGGTRISILSPASDPDGFVPFGAVLRPGLTLDQLSQITFRHIASFTAPFVNPAPTFVASAASIPAGQAGFYIIAVPEPSSLTLATLTIAACVAAFRLTRPWGRV